MTAKINIAQAATDLLGLSGSLIQASNDDSSRAVRYLERLCLDWQNQGLITGYIAAADALNPDPNASSGLAGNQLEAVIHALAVRLSPHYGIQPSFPLLTAAKSSYENLFSVELTPYSQNPMQPAGQGNRQCSYQIPYMPVETSE